MRLKAIYEGGSRFTVACRSHTMTVDQPKDNGGEDMGMTPPEIMAGSLASCIAFYVAKYCEQAKINAAGLEVSCDWTVADKPKYISQFQVAIDLPNLPEKRRKAIERVASSCLIHATLAQQPEVTISLS